VQGDGGLGRNGGPTGQRTEMETTSERIAALEEVYAL
jgi:hypothetical protein